ncbi:MAG: hypothetical protein ABIO70_34430 [Pseudomonadota bacterium]
MTLKRALLGRVILPAAGWLGPLDSVARMEAMLAADAMPPAAREALVLQRLRELVAHAARETVHYREALAGTGLEGGDLGSLADVVRLPVTTKADLRRGFPERQLARARRGRWLRWSNTSGTTGRPLVLAQDAADISAKYASKLWSRRVAGVDPLGRVTRMTPNECQPCLPSGERGLSLRSLARAPGPTAYLFIEDALVNRLVHGRAMLPPLLQHGRLPAPWELDRCLERIETEAPDLLVIYPLFARLLARHVLASGRRPPRLPGILDFSGGLLTPAMRAQIEAGFGVRSVQCCGGCEFARYGAACPDDPDHLHLAETHCHLEILRPDGVPCAPGELGNVIVTSLHSRALPVLRLEPGDVGRLIVAPCTCGRTTRRLQHEGRVHGLLRTAEGRWVSAREVWDALLALEGVELFQLRQRSSRAYELDVLAARHEALDEEAVRGKLEGLLGVGAEIALRRVESILPEASGKLQLVKSFTYEEFRVVGARRSAVPVN